MKSAVRIECELRSTLPATLSAIEEFFVEFHQCHHALMNRVNGFAAELMVREALTNAVVHGCHADAGKTVRCCLRLKSGRLLIVVADDGEGFDWRGARNDPAVFSECSGRGVGILRKYANHVRYNDRGNKVSIVKRLY